MKDSDGNDFRGRVRLFGRNVLAGPLFESSDVRTIVMDDDEGRPAVILARLDDNAWVMGNRSDPDWAAVKARFGVD